MGAAITLAGERLIAEKQAAGEVLEVRRFVLALVPDLDPEQPLDREAGKPPPEQIVFTAPYTQKGFVNPNQVAYSLMMGSDIGDFDWNWLGLETEEEVLLTVAYVPVQEKRKNIPPHQIGNNVTRNILVAFDGAQELTAIHVDASTWQHDFTVRLTGIDERERLSNRELFGRACFFGESLAMEQVDGSYQLKSGLAYVEGIRLEQLAVLPVAPDDLPTTAWLDVALQRDLNDRGATWAVVFSDDLQDYTDSAGVRHYCIPIADLPDTSRVVDRRPVEPIDGPLLQHFAARIGDYPALRARATTKDDVGLDQLPNAKSDDPDTNSSEILATTAALNKLNQQISDALVGMVAAFDMETAPLGWLKCNGAAVSREAYAKLFAVIGTRYGAGDGSTTFNLSDLRGQFIRGWSDGGGIDPARALGSLQDGQNASHTHTGTADLGGVHSHGGGTHGAGDHTHSASTTINGDHQHGIYATGNNTSFGRQGTGSGPGDYAAQTTVAGAHAHGVTIGVAGEHYHSLVTDNSAAHTHTLTVDASGGNEVRPTNVAYLICIKY
ncbi:phage tail protein [Pseudomonas batumici]|uniref:phage tail-collar fiber domain-containing protein n=1 Tax=Pseudomonas batumici TaxID=226910 RepID=UPI0030D2F008